MISNFFGQNGELRWIDRFQFLARFDKRGIVLVTIIVRLPVIVQRVDNHAEREHISLRIVGFR